MSNSSSTKHWDIEIKPKTGLFDIGFQEIWRYRDLLMMFVKRDFVTVYKQTLLGPFWFFIQPVMTTLIYVIIFGHVARIPTDNIPPTLFYICGITTWNYFSEAFVNTSKTFLENANIFGKVYFPRLILPLSKVVSGLIKFSIQFALFLGIFFYYYCTTNDLHPNWTIVLIPYYMLIMAVLGLGFGIIFSSLTTKYRDLTFLISFGIQLLMYATPIIYPVSQIKDKLFLTLIKANPMTAIVEGFRYAFLGSGVCDWNLLLYSTCVAAVALITGVIIFNRVEKSFMDTV